MTMHSLRATTAVAIIGLVIGTGATFAEGTGYVGLSFGNNEAENPEDNFSEKAVSATLDTAYAFGVGNNQTLVFEGMYRSDHYPQFVSDNNKIKDQYQIGVHYLYSFGGSNQSSGDSFGSSAGSSGGIFGGGGGGGLMLGGFAAYGSAPHEDSAPNNENYKVAIAGLEAIYNVNEYFTVFGQIGRGDRVGSRNTSSRGFDGGSFARLGVVYDWMRGTRFTLEGEVGKSDRYEDNSEPGDFSTYSISGETDLPFINDRLSATYGMRFALFDAENDSDYLKETSLNLGVRYKFGKKSSNLARAGIIGLPHIPLRASVFTPTMD